MWYVGKIVATGGRSAPGSLYTIRGAAWLPGYPPALASPRYTLLEIAVSINYIFNCWQVPLSSGFKQQIVQMQHPSFVDRATAIPKDENLNSSESDTSNRKYEDGSKSLADDATSSLSGECESDSKLLTDNRECDGR